MVNNMATLTLPMVNLLLKDMRQMKWWNVSGYKIVRDLFCNEVKYGPYGSSQNLL